jgi:hypothetical protein
MAMAKGVREGMEMTNASICVTYPHTVRCTSRWVTSKVINPLDTQHVDDVNNELKGYTIDYTTPIGRIPLGAGLFFYGNESIGSLKAGPGTSVVIEENANTSVTIAHGIDSRDADIYFSIGSGDSSFTLDGSSYISDGSSVFFVDIYDRPIIISGSVVVDSGGQIFFSGPTTLNGNITVKDGSALWIGVTSGQGKIEVDSDSFLSAGAIGSGITVELNDATLSLAQGPYFLATIDLHGPAAIHILANEFTALPVREIFNTQTGVMDLLNPVGGIFEQLTFGDHHRVVYAQIDSSAGYPVLSLTHSSDSLPITIMHSPAT